VRSYQQQNNLSASGQLDQQTLASLNLGNNQNYGSSSTGQQPSSQANGNDSQSQPMNASQPSPQQNAQSNQQSNTTTR
jgi:hypothetical protein